MSQIDELQRRIAAALDRIGQGLDGIQSAGGDEPPGLETLRQELDDEKTANEQLQERVLALKAKRDAAEVNYENARAAQSETIQKLDADLQSLRKANQQLRENNQALRDAIGAGISEPHLVNKAMLAELEGLRAAHTADRTETATVLQELARAIDTASGGETEMTQPEDA